MRVSIKNKLMFSGIIAIGIFSAFFSGVIKTPFTYIVIDSIMKIESVGVLSAKDQSEIASKLKNNYEVSSNYRGASIFVLVIGLYGFVFNSKCEKYEKG